MTLAEVQGVVFSMLFYKIPSSIVVTSFYLYHGYCSTYVKSHYKQEQSEISYLVCAILDYQIMLYIVCSVGIRVELRM